jgi:GT2 family glycosyltransferase
MEIVIVDNASIDGLAPRVKAELPWVRVIESVSNTGFAGGVNQGLGDLASVDYVALINNDAVPEPGWLAPLVSTLEADRTLGAANSKIVFAPQFVAVGIESPTFLLGAGDPFGVCVSGIEVDGQGVWNECQFARGFHPAETRRDVDDLVCWTDGNAELRVPVAPGRGPGAVALLELSAENEKTVRLSCGSTAVDVRISRESTWHKVPLSSPTFDVINNVGSRLVEGGYGGDRGYLERDQGQYESAEEVFAWCGAAVLLATRYLRDMGRFDDRYFVYYEDTDLSWRGRIGGWRYLYVPESVVRHVHAATTREGSALFAHYVERNRFLTLARNAPWSVLFDALYVYLRDTLVIFKRDVFGRMRKGRGPSAGASILRLRAALAFVKLLPVTLASRARQRCSPRRRRAIVDRWMVPR